VEPFGIALTSDGECLESFLMNTSFQKTENLSHEIHALLTRHGLDFQQVSGVGICIGPGQYTSLRLSVSVVKTLSQIVECPIIPFQTLEALYLSSYPSSDPVCAVIPARKGEVNAQLFSASPSAIQPVSNFFSCTFEEFDSFLSSFNAPLTVIGVFPRGYKMWDNDTTISFKPCHINPLLLCEETERRLASGLGVTFDKFSVIYSHQPV